jgi:hypothetical protein
MDIDDDQLPPLLVNADPYQGGVEGVDRVRVPITLITGR